MEAVAVDPSQGLEHTGHPSSVRNLTVLYKTVLSELNLPEVAGYGVDVGLWHGTSRAYMREGVGASFSYCPNIWDEGLPVQ